MACATRPSVRRPARLSSLTPTFTSRWVRRPPERHEGTAPGQIWSGVRRLTLQAVPAALRGAQLPTVEEALDYVACRHHFASRRSRDHKKMSPALAVANAITTNARSGAN